MDSPDATALIRSELLDLRSIIASSDDIRQLKSLRDKAEAVRTYAKSAALGLELLNDAAELKIRAERRAGDILAQLQLRGGNRRSPGRKPAVTLKELGVTRNQSRNWQRENLVPEKQLDRLMSALRAEGKEISTAAVLRLARDYEPSTCRKRMDEVGNDSEAGVLRSLADLVDQRMQFSCVLVTPFWPMPCGRTSRSGRQSNAARLRLQELPVDQLCSDSCHIHLWCDEPHVQHAQRVLRSWGFAVRGRLVCLAPHGSYGKYWRASHSHVLLGVRGDLPFRNNSLMSWLECEHVLGRPRLTPVYELLEQAGVPPFLHVFGEKPRHNWTVIPDGTARQT